ncbi:MULTISPECIES: proline--tRNA ligase [unclassified Dehalobacter]|uniref:proline--tRNA ligase n=1 Tax=unclassified Dehalobacter TaxID=2635733 RepID=UPI000E6BE6E5|nr:MULTISPECIES: proline--tRNA ligase [unclassified Dehalobacter]RJE49149.1 proline--tRNA ligase [Dehalobacter sp. MCB1]TCX49434.1 proline--tRNA ligase [Dehalobacter sp. 12DCB1]TCX53188.1 proline--tRNA ligase [Dehalobacter sp. 14DCB1]
MKASQLLNPTLREVPAEAEVISHQLMLRAGFIRKAAAGIYTYLPLGLRVIKKIEQIVRQEMDAKGGQEVMLPIVQPAELWKETGRWDVYGPEMFRLKDRHDREFCLGPTHEEVITDLVRSEVRSYKQLPLLLYQIQNKYRDERRPRFGLMRGREFIMKDLYSFDRDPEGSRESYRKMYEAYERIFTRCGLTFRAVEADAGAIGGTGGTHEFMVLAESGEAAVVFCPDCDYAANVEKAECLPCPDADQDILVGWTGEVHTPGIKTIDQLADFLKVNKSSLIKTLLYKGDDRFILVLVRGDREVNEIKVNNKLGPFLNLRMADPEEVREVFNCEHGFIGPVGLKDVYIAADLEVAEMKHGVCGANKKDYHLLGVACGKDFIPAIIADLRMVAPGEPCPNCQSPLQEARGIEVGQVFNLGTKYSQALQATYLDDTGKEKVCYMGCYGIGVSRTMAAAIEQNYDENGIIWPMPIAPYHCIIVPVTLKDENVVATAERLYAELKAAGVETVYDDRDERPGVKFKDADLVGYPLRLTIGAKALAEGKVELYNRSTRQVELVEADRVCSLVTEIIKEACRV